MTRTHTPKSEAELAEIVAQSAKNRTALKIQGGGTRPIGNRVAAGETVMTTGIKGVSLYEPGALTIIANAGTPLEKVNQTLLKENQHLPFEPADYSGLFAVKGKSTIGGVVAAAISGPRRIQAGACRDSLIGIRFVDGEGRIIKNGGRVMKNVTGYDLVKLFAGSYGTLGILTEVAFKILPKPEVTGVVRITGLEDHKAVQALAKALGSPFDVSGAAHLQKGDDGKPLTLLRVEGFEQSIKYRTRQLKDLLTPHLPAEADLSIDMAEKSTATIWKKIRDVEPFHNQAGHVWRISVKPSHGPEVIAELASAMALEAIYDWGGGLVWLLLPEPKSGEAALIRKAVNKVGGHATFIKGEAVDIEAFHPESKRISQLSQGIRRQFDPVGIFNPGLMSRQLAGV